LSVALLASGFLAATGAAGQERPETPAQAPAPPPAERPSRPFDFIGRELKIYYDDSKALFFAPFHWNETQAWKAVGAGALVGSVMVFDEPLATSVQSRASAATRKR
jgi:hypothetical protein